MEGWRRLQRAGLTSKYIVQPLWESVAILLYLVHHYDKENKLWFTNEDEIADAHQWLLFQASGVGPYFGQKAWFDHYHHEKLPSAIERYDKEIQRGITAHTQ